MYMAIQEFLTEKGFKRTLVSFQSEQQTVRDESLCTRPRSMLMCARSPQVSSVRPSNESWYKVSDYIDLVGIRDATRRRGEAKYGTVLESMVLFLKGQRDKKLNRAKSSPAVAAATPTPEHSDPRISSNPLKDCDPVFLWTEQQRRAEQEAAEAARHAQASSACVLGRIHAQPVRSLSDVVYMHMWCVCVCVCVCGVHVCGWALCVPVAGLQTQTEARPLRR